MPDIILGLAVYYWLGATWIASGCLPQPWGWLTFPDKSLWRPLAWIVLYGAIWPLILCKIVKVLVWDGKREIHF